MSPKEQIRYILDCIYNDAGGMWEALLEILSEDGQQFDISTESINKLIQWVEAVE